MSSADSLMLSRETYDRWADSNKKSAARIEELERGIREYLGEYDTPAKDYAYRAACREKLRRLVKTNP